MRTCGKIGLVAAGYVGALLVACAAVAIYIAFTNGPARDASSGMYAFGDSLVFLAVFGLAAVPATSAAFFFLRPHRWFWQVLSVLALVVAATAVAASILYAVGRNRAAGPGLAWADFSILRLFGAPLLAGAAFLAGLLAPDRRFRIALFVACLIEAVAFASFLWVWLSLY
jgi:hypothetical protein